MTAGRRALFSSLLICGMTALALGGHLVDFKGQLRNIINEQMIKTIKVEADAEVVEDNIMLDTYVDLPLERPKQLRPLIGSSMKSYQCHAHDVHGWPVVVRKEDYDCELCYAIAYRDGIQDMLEDRLHLQISAKGRASLQTDHMHEFRKQMLVDAKLFADQTIANVKPCSGIETIIRNIYKRLRETLEGIIEAAVERI